MLAKITVLSLFALLLSSCNNEPDPIGVDLLPDNDLLQVVTYDTSSDSAFISSSTYIQPLTASSSTLLSVGKAEGYTSYILMRWFLFPDTIGYAGSIVSSTITLNPSSYAVGDTLLGLQFEVKEIDAAWSSFTFTSDSLEHFVTTGVVGSFNQVVDTSAIEISIDSAVVRKWLMMSNEGESFNIRGVLLDPQVSESNIRAFGSALAEKPPALTIVLDTGSGLDTITAGAPEFTYVATGAPFEEGSGMTLNGALAYRGKIFFDVSSVPAGKVINNAALHFSRDPEKSQVFYQGIDEVHVHVSRDSAENTFAATTIIARPVETESDKFLAEGRELTAAVQDWVNGKVNNGLILRYPAEQTDFDRFYFYGADAPFEQRPQLVITYTTRP